MSGIFRHGGRTYKAVDPGSVFIDPLTELAQPADLPAGMVIVTDGMGGYVFRPAKEDLAAQTDEIARAFEDHAWGWDAQAHGWRKGAGFISEATVHNALDTMPWCAPLIRSALANGAVRFWINLETRSDGLDVQFRWTDEHPRSG